MTDTLPIIAELLDPSEQERDFPKLRRAAGEVLKPGPWRHRLVYIADDRIVCHKCSKPSNGNLCNEHDCPVPDSDARELAVIAEELVRKTNSVSIAQAASEMAINNSPHDVLCWWIDADAATQTAAILLALGKARTE